MIHAKLYRNVAIALSFFIGTVASAQGTSVLLGTVTDAATGKALQHAVVTATSTALLAPQTVVTDSTGYYRIPGLPPGRYTVKVEREGFRPFSRSDLNVQIDRQYRVNIAAQPESMSSAEITIATLPPIVDISSASQGVVADREFIDRLPTINLQGGDPYTSLAVAAPQAQSDVGGLSISGTSGLETSYVIDGVSVRDNQTGGNSGKTPLSFINQVNVNTGGFQAEIGRTTGGAIRSVTRSGSNEFHGDVWVNYTPGGMFPLPKATRSSSSPFVSQEILWNAIDVSATLGGPILKDRIWFFAGISPSRGRTQMREWIQALKLNANGDDYLYGGSTGIQYTDIDGSRRTNFNDTLSLPFIAKLTFLLAENHTLTFSTNGTFESSQTPASLHPRGPVDAVSWNGGGSQLSFNNSLVLQYQGSFFDKRLLVQSQVSWYRSSKWLEYSDGSSISNSPRGSATGTPQVATIYADFFGTPYSYNNFPWLSSYYDAATRARIAAACSDAMTSRGPLQRCPLTAGGPLTIGGAGSLSSTLNDTVQANASVTYLLKLLGHHVWKAGVDYEWIQNQTTKAYSGGVAYFDVPGLVFLQRGYGYLTGPDQMNVVKSITSTSSSHQIAWYLQDSWFIMDKVTLNAGLRYDNQQLFNTSGGLGMTINNQIAPRISLAWDPTQQGRSKLYASYGRYFQSVPLSIVDRLLNGDSELRSMPSSFKQNGCDPLNNFASVYTSCPGSGAQNVNDAYRDKVLLSRKYGFPGTTVAPVDPALKPQSSDEVTAGAEYEIFRDARLAASYTRRWVNDVIEDVSVDNGLSYFISNPGSGLASSFPRAVRNYNAVTVQLSKNFQSGWMAQASYTWTNLTGNYEGLTSGFQTSNPNNTKAFDLRDLLVNASGRLPGDINHSIKVYGGKEFSITSKFSLALFIKYMSMSGRPVSYMGSHPLYGNDTVFILPRGIGGESPWIHSVDLSVAAGVKLGGDLKLQIRIDALNILNLEGALALNSTLTPASVLPLRVPAGTNPQVAACIAGSNVNSCSENIMPIQKTDGSPLMRGELNPSFKLPLYNQSPFTARFSIRLSF